MKKTPILTWLAAGLLAAAAAFPAAAATTAMAASAKPEEAKLVLAKDAPLARDYILDGRKFVLTIVFDPPSPKEPLPLVSVLYNGQLAWEDYLDRPELALTLPSEIGRNTFKVMVENRSIRLKKIKITADTGATRPDIGL